MQQFCDTKKTKQKKCQFEQRTMKSKLKEIENAFFVENTILNCSIFAEFITPWKIFPQIMTAIFSR
jgi:hypothetical protein